MKKQRTHLQQSLNPNALALNNDNAAALLDISPTSLKISRSTGLLCGKSAPAFKKADRKVFYLRSALEQWLEDLPDYKNTAQIKEMQS